MQPTAYQSVQGPMPRFDNCSGAMYDGVPAAKRVELPESVNFARPKSTSRTKSGCAGRVCNITFAGFTSR